MTQFSLKKATRQGIKPLIGIYAESGCGKTMSALLLARGFAGNGKIGLIDTESGRGSLYADVIPGGYDVLDLAEPFSPSRYIDALKFVESSGVAVLVVDSASHEWEGIGGVTDMAMEISKVRSSKYNREWDGVVQFGDWKQPKTEHQRFMLKLLQSPLPIIVCLRAKRKSNQTKVTQEMVQAGLAEPKQIGRSVVIKDDFTTPIQAEDFIYEMTAHCEILKDHTTVLTKCSHPSLRACFPADRTTPITIEHGKMLAEWCNNAGGPKAFPLVSATGIDALKKELWTITKPIHGGERSAFQHWLVNEMLMEPAMRLEELTEQQLTSIINLAKNKL